MCGYVQDVWVENIDMVEVEEIVPVEPKIKTESIEENPLGFFKINHRGEYVDIPPLLNPGESFTVKDSLGNDETWVPEIPKSPYISNNQSLWWMCLSNKKGYARTFNIDGCKQTTHIHMVLCCLSEEQLWLWG